MLKSKKGVAVFVPIMIVLGLAASGFALFQFNKAADTVGATAGGWLGVPVFGWVVIILLLLIYLRS